MLRRLVIGFCLLVSACSPAEPTASPTPLPPTSTPTSIPTIVPTATEAAAVSTVEFLVPQVLSVRPHDTAAFTEGLLWHEGSLYESTGQNGNSYVREVNPETGEVLRQVDAPDDVFGEGISIVGNRIIELTWRNEVAFVYDLETFASVGTFTYEGEGWALCYDGERLVMTDGTPNLFFRNPETFELIGQVAVTLDGQPISNLNEIECVDGQVYANVWLTDGIVRIDPTTGNVTASIDATGLLTAEERAAAGSNGVLNGIAYVPEEDVFFITGKLWPHLFEVRFVPSEEDAVG
ncbi:MAG: glutaminyl-peptide cyclotransferase [Anaerolineae bacterium]